MDAAASAQRPLQGVVLCCTSLPQHVRTHLADVAVQMGAVHKLDLTSDVTHLVVGDITTPKYRYVAKERPDITVLHPDWIEAVRRSWIEGGEVDVRALEKSHRLPVFYGLKTCLTGFDNTEERNDITSAMQRQGAEHHGDLTKKVTHLVAATPSGAKYTHAKQWGIPVVSLKWVRDSLRRGMVLNETLYDPTLPVPDQGKDAFRTLPKPSTSLGKRAREGDAQAAPGPDGLPRKLRRTASTRLNSQSQDLWQDLSAQDPVHALDPGNQWNDEPVQDRVHPPSRDNLPGTVARGADASHRLLQADQEPRALFSGAYILLHAFDHQRSARLRKFLEPNGASIVESPSELDAASSNPFFRSRYLLVPHSNEDPTITLPDVPAGTEVVTEWWVERCLHHKTLFSPEQDMLSRPFWNALVPGFSTMTVSTTGFTGVELRQTAGAVKLMGATYEEKIVPTLSVLVSGSNGLRPEKALYAAKHGITVVRSDWLWQCVSTSRRVPFDEFRIELPAYDSRNMTGEPSTSSPAPGDIPQRSLSGLAKTNDGALPKRLSNTRQRHAVPSLPLQAMRATKPVAGSTATLRAGPFIVDDDHEPSPPPDPDIPSPSAMPPASPKLSQPLREISLNASTRTDRSANQSESLYARGSEKPSNVDQAAVPAAVVTSQMSRHPSPPKIATADASEDLAPPPPTRPQEELNADLASILYEAASRATDSPTSDRPATKRKSRPLGRNLSGVCPSHRSASASATPDVAASSTAPEPADRPPSSATPTSDSEAQSAADGFARGLVRDVALPPSTQLGYESAEAAQHRLAMEKRMKMSLRDATRGERVASLGTVKDSGGPGVGTRGKGRRAKG